MTQDRWGLLALLKIFLHKITDITDIRSTKSCTSEKVRCRAIGKDGFVAMMRANPGNNALIWIPRIGEFQKTNGRLSHAQNFCVHGSFAHLGPHQPSTQTFTKFLPAYTHALTIISSHLFVDALVFSFFSISTVDISFCDKLFSARITTPCSSVQHF